MGLGAEEVVASLSVVSAIFSFIIAAYVLDRYKKTEHKHLILWGIAWILVGIRNIGEMFLAHNINDLSISYALDVLTMVHCLLWFVGLADLLDKADTIKKWFPIMFGGAHLVLAGFFYMGMENQYYASIVSYGIFIPLILLIVGMYFYVPATTGKKTGVSLVSGGFFLWATVYMAFALPGIVFENFTLAAVGFLLALVVRAMLFVGFVLMVKEAKD